MKDGLVSTKPYRGLEGVPLLFFIIFWRIEDDIARNSEMEQTHSFTLISHKEAMRNVLARVDTIGNSDWSMFLTGKTSV